MFKTARWAKIALFLNLLGVVALFLSFQATSSDFKLVSVVDNDHLKADGTHFVQYSICVGDIAMLMTDGLRSGVFGPNACPTEGAKAAAVVNTESPALVWAGFALTAVGFFLQWLGVPADDKGNEERLVALERRMETWERGRKGKHR